MLLATVGVLPVSNLRLSIISILRAVPFVLGAIGNFLMCFSLYTNGFKILSTKQPPGSLTCINGIRFISMSWVILGHTLAISIPSVSKLLPVDSHN